MNDNIFNGEIYNPNVAYEMTAKMFSLTNSDIVVTATGDNIGNCYIAVGDKNEIHVYKNKFVGTYNEIIDYITTASYFYLIKKLKKNDFHFEKSTV